MADEIKAPWEMQPTDTPKSWEAFQIYRDMGKKRSLKRVAEQLKKSETIIGRWSGQHNWQERVAAWEDEQDRLIRIELTKGIGNMRKRHADIAGQMLLKAAQALQKIPVDEVKASDISRMVDIASKLERLSRGDTSEVIEQRDGGQAMDPVQIYIPDNNRESKEDQFDDLEL